MGNFPSCLACVPQKHVCYQKCDGNVRFRAVRVVLLVSFYNRPFFLDSFRLRPVHEPRRWTKVIRSSTSFCSQDFCVFCQNKLTCIRLVFSSSSGVVKILATHFISKFLVQNDSQLCRLELEVPNGVGARHPQRYMVT